jgi:hypothetical protein
LSIKLVEEAGADLAAVGLGTAARAPCRTYAHYPPDAPKHYEVSVRRRVRKRPRAQYNPSPGAADIPFPTTLSPQWRPFSHAAARIFMRRHHVLVSSIGTVAGSSGVFGPVGPRICGTLYLEFGEKSSPKAGE